MMGEKLITLLIYVLVGLGLTVVAPLLYRHRASRAGDDLTLVRSRSAIRIAFGMLIGLFVMTFLPWWLRQPRQWFSLSLSAVQMVSVVLLTVTTCWMLTRKMSVEQDTSLSRRLRALIYAAFGIGILCLVFSTGWLLTFPGTSLWHHWGAYVGPALLVAEGAHPLYDIPTQYGLGVTLVLAQGCQLDCWSGMYWTAGLMTTAMTALLGYLALQFNGSRHPLSVFATLAIVLICGLFWTANPRGLAAPLSFPSTTGMRFFPGVLMLALLACHARQRHAVQMPPVWGHLLWLACIMWSPEAGVHATVLWTSYFVWTRIWASSDSNPIARFAWAVTLLVIVLVGGLALIALGYRLLLGDFPEIATYFAYLLYPPGPLPVNPFGTIWFAIACVICWGLGWWQMPSRSSENLNLAICSWLSALLCFASFTYYLGRSHDNNILNLLPIFALMLQATRSMAQAGTVQMLATTLLAACVGWMPVFGFETLSTAYSQGRLLEFAPRQLVKAFSRDPANGPFYVAPEQVRADLNAALQRIHRDYGEPVEVFDRFLLVDSEKFGVPWNAWAGPANFAFLPSHWRRVYLARVAKRLNRSGWVLYEKEYEGVLPDFDSAYRRVEELNFGTYKAVRFIPR